MDPSVATSLKSLRRLGRRPKPGMEPSRCDLCRAVIATEHAHLVEPESGRVLCACEACSILFGNQKGQKYRRAPREIVELVDFALEPLQWENLAIPIGLAFLYRSTPAHGIVAIYPSPVGPLRSEPPAEAWEELVRCNPGLQTLEDDCEALLVQRIHGVGDAFRVPIDEGYRLTGLIRARWKGISGGPEVEKEIVRFFVDLRKRAVTHA